MSVELYKKFSESIMKMRDNPVQWRKIAAKQIAGQLNIPQFGVTGVYLFGSTDSETASSNSDIDLIIRVTEHNADTEPILREWLWEWDVLLCDLNYAVTGKILSNMLDIHIVSEADIIRHSCFGSKINSVYDPATSLWSDKSSNIY